MNESERAAERIVDARERIETVVKRYRETVGRDKYRYEFRWISKNWGILTVPIFLLCWYMTALMILAVIPNAIFRYIGYGMLIVMTIALPLSGRLVKVKVWKDDYVSEEDLVYLCQNSLLKDEVMRDFSKEIKHTYTYLDDQRAAYTDNMCRRAAAKKHEQLIKKVTEVEPEL